MLLLGMPKNLLCKEELFPNLIIHGHLDYRLHLMKPVIQVKLNKFNREKTISDNYVGRFENV